ncbi:diacylglycerol kinase [Elusimicrobiota bacterium]
MSEEDKRAIVKSSVVQSFDYALRGLVYAIRNERNMKIHFIIAILVLIISLFLNLTRMELIAIIFSIALVLITEILNSASERIVNLITEKHHPVAKIIKDMCAGAVLFASICAAVVGVLIFIRPEVLEVFEKSIVIEKISNFPPYITSVVVFLVLVISLFIKAVKKKQMSLVGGMPSIHTAVAFSLATAAYLLSSNVNVLLVSVFLAAMVAQARVSSKIHNIPEVIVGAILGVSLTLLIFQIVV